MMASEAIFRVAEPQNGIVCVCVYFSKCVGGVGENKRGDTNRNQRARTVLQGQLAIRRSYTCSRREFPPFSYAYRDVSPPHMIILLL